MQKLILSSILFISSCTYVVDVTSATNTTTESISTTQEMETTATTGMQTRGLDYDSWYINQNMTKISLQTFAKMVLACEGLQKVDLAVTYTRYHKPITSSKTQVIGLGFSANVEDPMAQCYQDMIISMGGKPF